MEINKNAQESGWRTSIPHGLSAMATAFLLKFSKCKMLPGPESPLFSDNDAIRLWKKDFCCFSDVNSILNVITQHYTPREGTDIG